MSTAATACMFYTVFLFSLMLFFTLLTFLVNSEAQGHQH